MNKMNIDREDEKYLEFIANLGFQYCETIKAIPDDLKEKLNGYFDMSKTESPHKRVVNTVFAYSSKVLALKRGFSPEDRKAYLKIKKNMADKKM